MKRGNRAAPTATSTASGTFAARQRPIGRRAAGALALTDFNIDARLNGAYVALGLLYGGGDFARTLELTTRMGQDSDCNPSSAAGIVGVMLGYSRIPVRFTAGIPPIAHRRFAHTSYSFDEITRSTVARALDVVRQAGGQIGEGRLTVPRQASYRPRLEQWSMGVPTARIGIGDPRWKFVGSWTTQGTADTIWLGDLRRKVSRRGGNEARCTFEGTAVAVVGRARPDGGQARVFLDGRPVATVDAYAPQDTNDIDLWHTDGLRPGQHALRIVTSDGANARSNGTRVEVALVVQYAAEPTR